MHSLHRSADDTSARTLPSRSDVIQQFEFAPPPGSPRAFKFEVLVTTYEIALRDSDLLRNVPWVYLMVDEAHRLKNKQSALYQVR